MNDISTAEVDSRMCWVSKDQKFHAKNESTSNELQKTGKLHQKGPFFWADFPILL